MKKITILGAVCSLMLLSPMHLIAQNENSLKVTPTGRILLDGGMYVSDNTNFVNGASIPDTRIGVKFSYGKYKAKIDVGFAYGSVSLKDIYIERKLSPHSLLRAGNFVHQFGLQSATSSSMKISMEEPTSNEALFNSRLVGAMFVYDRASFFGTASIHVESEAMKKRSNELGETGYGAMSRLVYRPLRNSGELMLQIGISGAYESPRYNSDPNLNHSSFVLGANFPTRLARVSALNAVVTKANYLYKFTPELLVAYGPVALESQYYYLQVNRKTGFDDYKATGAYGLLRGLILGGDYRHSYSDWQRRGPVHWSVYSDIIIPICLMPMPLFWADA